jgi:ketosteroid isomerase-like protein
MNQLCLCHETNATDFTMNTGVAGQAFLPDRAWWERVFAIVDAGDTAGFMDLLTPDARFRFGNAPVIIGADAIREVVRGFFKAIASSRHQLFTIWNGPATAVCEGVVVYTRHDGSTLSVPFANVFELEGDRISAYRIYIDNSSLFSNPA